MPYMASSAGPSPRFLEARVKPDLGDELSLILWLSDAKDPFRCHFLQGVPPIPSSQAPALPFHVYPMSSTTVYFSGHLPRH